MAKPQEMIDSLDRFFDEYAVFANEPAKQKELLDWAHRLLGGYYRLLKSLQQVDNMFNNKKQDEPKK